MSDVPLLDELVDLLGRDKPADDTAERQRAAETAYAAGVLDNMISREDLMDDEDHLLAQDMLYAEDLAERFIERDNRELTERAAADRDWTYRHVVVDEAQELSEMDWRVLMRRCPSRSFTVVGDLAQRRSAAGARSWDTMLEPYVPGRWVYRSLSVNYRTPAEIMTVAAALLAEFAPEIRPPESVRACGVLPWSRRVTEDELPTAIEEFVRDESGREGTSVVIGPPGVPGAVLPSETKGLEFDAVLVVDPDRILASGPRGAAELYVALTRATQRLGVLHQAPLPESLTGLAESGDSRTTGCADEIAVSAVQVGRLLPGEHRLFELVDRVMAALQAQPPQLQQHGTRRRVDEVVAERDLHDRARALRDGDVPRRILPQQLMQPDPVDRHHLVGCGTKVEPSAAPDDHRGDHVAGSGRVVVEQSQHG